jgi:hypothetical protein
VQTPWIDDTRLARTLARHEAFWRGDLEDGPLLWLTAPGTKVGPLIPEPAKDEELWTNVDYVIANAESSPARTHFAGDALPVFCPWLGPDQVAGWLGSELQLKPKENTSWSKPFVEDWNEHCRVPIIFHQ